MYQKQGTVYLKRCILQETKNAMRAEKLRRALAKQLADAEESIKRHEASRDRAASRAQSLATVTAMAAAVLQEEAQVVRMDNVALQVKSILSPLFKPTFQRSV